MTASRHKPDQGDLSNLRAAQGLHLLKQKEISPIDLVNASINSIEVADKKVKAPPMRRFEKAREEAKRIPFETEIQNSHSLHGLPIVVKDYNDVGGIPTTFGSPIFAVAFQRHLTR